MKEKVLCGRQYYGWIANLTHSGPVTQYGALHESIYSITRKLHVRSCRSDLIRSLETADNLPVIVVSLVNIP